MEKQEIFFTIRIMHTDTHHYTAASPSFLCEDDRDPQVELGSLLCGAMFRAQEIGLREVFSSVPDLTLGEAISEVEFSLPRFFRMVISCSLAKILVNSGGLEVLRETAHLMEEKELSEFLLGMIASITEESQVFECSNPDDFKVLEVMSLTLMAQAMDKPIIANETQDFTVAEVCEFLLEKANGNTKIEKMVKRIQKAFELLAKLERDNHLDVHQGIPLQSKYKH